MHPRVGDGREPVVLAFDGVQAADSVGWRQWRPSLGGFALGGFDLVDGSPQNIELVNQRDVDGTLVEVASGGRRPRAGGQSSGRFSSATRFSSMVASHKGIVLLSIMAMSRTFRPWQLLASGLRLPMTCRRSLRNWVAQPMPSRIAHVTQRGQFLPSLVHRHEIGGISDGNADQFDGHALAGS